MIEKYIKELKEKNDIKSMKVLVREYDKQIDFYRNNKAITGNSCCSIILLGIIVSCFVLVIGTMFNLFFVKLIYGIPILVVSFNTLFLFLKTKRDKFNDKKIFYKYVIMIFITINLICFSSTYVFQIATFGGWEEIYYIRSILLLIGFLIPVIIATIYDSPKRFLKEFSKSNRKYSNVSSALGGIITVGIVIFNVTKPYFLVLSLSYILTLWFTWATSYFVFKYKQYDLIEDLREYIESIEEK